MKSIGNHTPSWWGCHVGSNRPWVLPMAFQVERVRFFRLFRSEN